MLAIEGGQLASAEHDASSQETTTHSILRKLVANFVTLEGVEIGGKFLHMVAFPKKGGATSHCFGQGTHSVIRLIGTIMQVESYPNSWKVPTMCV